MPSLFLKLLLPGETFSDDIAATSVTWAGFHPGWALLAWIGLLALLVWSYRRQAPHLSRNRRVTLIALRAFLLGLLLVLLSRPMLTLEIEERTRRTLAVLVDTSQSMTLADGRSDPADLNRAVVATGRQAAAGERISRSDLLAALALNPKLDLWSALHAKADLEFIGFGRELNPLGAPAPAEVGALFKTLAYDQKLTALGDSLRETLDRKRGRPLAGVLVITDGAGNTGAPPLEAARLAKQDGVPLYLYGVGVTTPRDLAMIEVNGPQLSFLRDRVTFTGRVRATGLDGQRTQITLLANGRKVAERSLELGAEGEHEVTLDFVPEELGDVALEMLATPLAGETVTENNSATASTRVVDIRTRILYIEGEPRWEFRYLLALLQRDRRLAVECVVLDGDPHLAQRADSGYLASIPDDKNRLFTYDAILIGDVDPKALGPTRMALLADWAEKNGGGLAFLAGPRFTPAAYRGTALEKLFPVELDAAATASSRYPEPVQLKLTPAGERSMVMSLADDPRDNAALWSSFPGVRWTAPVGRARPAAQVLLADPSTARATRSGSMPVIALQPYGLGQVAYIGTDTTHLWRSRIGERHHTRVWGQLIQSLTAARQRGGSQLTRLSSERARYLVGERVTLTGRAFEPDFSPLIDAALPGTLSVQAPEGPALLSELRLAALAGRPGEFRGEFVARTAGAHTFTAARDSAALVQFEVVEPRLEFADTAMNEGLLRAMAEASGGHFLREEDLPGLPALVAGGATGLPTFKAVDLALSPWLLGVLILATAAEWFIRRRSELK